MELKSSEQNSLGTGQTEEEQQALTREEAKLDASTPNVLYNGPLFFR